MSMKALMIVWLTVAGIFGLSNFVTAQGIPAADSSTTPITFTPEIPIPGLFSGQFTITGSSIVTYIRAIFIYFIWTVGILATVMVIYGGIKWVAAAGNPGRINDARDVINNAIIGVVIALTSVVLLNVISPQYTNLRGIELASLKKELGNFYDTLTQTITPCSANTVIGTPDIICTTTNICSVKGTLNEWINESVRPTGTSNWTGGLPDPVMVKAIIAKESLQDGRPVSRATEVLNSNGTPASSAYGIGQFVAATLIEQLDKLAKQKLTTIPAACPTNGKNPPGPLNEYVVEPTCKAWLDQTMSPSGSGVMPVGMKAQVFLVTNYLGEVGNADCVKHDIAKTAAAYFLGQGGVKYFCDPSAIATASPNRQKELEQRLEDAKQYVAVFSEFYQSYCTASSG